MAIYFDKETKTFYLEGKASTYAFFINNYGYAEHLYYGKKIHRDYLLFTRACGTYSFATTAPGGVRAFGHNNYQNMCPELTTFGFGDYREATVHAKFDRGDRHSELLYYGYDILTEKPKINGMPSLDGGETLVVHLYDESKHFGADLYYTVYPDCDVVARRIVYKNDSDSVVNLDRAYSFAFGLPYGKYDMISLYGGWAAERQMERYPLHHGVSSIDSKRASSSAILNPFIAVVDSSATETSGNAYGFNLVYSSSYVLKAEQVADGSIVVSGGINDFDFEWKLEGGESFETPEAVIAYSPDGIGGMSREFHDAYREHLIPKKHVKSPRPLLINNWEGTYFDFNLEKLSAIVDAVEGTGIDTFVLDDGWFGQRNDESQSLGDWVVNEEKLRGGLDAIIQHVRKKGMQFGLWFEPEMISENSDIYRAHPEYAITGPDGKHCLSRNQLMMDLTNPEARDYIVNSINTVLKNHDISYVKWDYNRNATEFFTEALPEDRRSEFAHRYALGVYDVFERIVNANPDIFFEGCSGGGSRFDPGVLAYFPQIWTSDNSDAEERTRIQYGTSLCYPLSAMSCHVSAVPNHQVRRVTKFDTRGDIAHLGATGYELDTTVFTDNDRAAVRDQIKKYKNMETLVLEGDLYRLDNPFDSSFFSFAIVSKDKAAAHLTCYRSIYHCNCEAHRVIMQGLDDKKEYYVPELNLIVHGSTLMSVGIPVKFKDHDFATVTYTFEEK